MSQTLEKHSPMDRLEAVMTEYPPADITAFHRFTPGMYVRECRIPKNTLLISETHLTQHPFVITEGVIEGWSDNEEAFVYGAGHVGITQPGTRRVLYAHEDTVWITFHATEETDLVKIGQTILEPHTNPIVGDHPSLHAWLRQLPTPDNTLT